MDLRFWMCFVRLHTHTHTCEIVQKAFYRWKIEKNLRLVLYNNTFCISVTIIKGKRKQISWEKKNVYAENMQNRSNTQHRRFDLDSPVVCLHNTFKTETTHCIIINGEYGRIFLVKNPETNRKHSVLVIFF